MIHVPFSQHLYCRSSVEAGSINHGSSSSTAISSKESPPILSFLDRLRVPKAFEFSLMRARSEPPLSNICHAVLCLYTLFYSHNETPYMYICRNYVENNRCLCIINPRRTCAARITVLGLCVCLSVCLSTTILGLQATRRLMSDTNNFSCTIFLMISKSKSKTMQYNS